MELQDMIQGSNEWHVHRAQHFNASDAPAMLGCSPYKTRAELLRELKTGITPEVGNALQRRFDSGHRFEALARPLAEKIVGEDLYPVVGSEDELSASFDGLTMDGLTAFEHKSLNDELRACMKDQGNGYGLPKHYQVQMEQQLIVSGAERVLFMASKWDGDTLVEERHCWYASDPKLRAEIIAGWRQFAEDLATYVPPAAAVAIVAEPVQALPAVVVQVSGEISVKDNFQAFETALRDFLEHRLIRSPKTDQDFANLDVQIKAMKGAEAALDSAEVQMLAQVQTIDQAKKTKDMLAKLVRENRLMAEKLLTSEKERRKAEIVSYGATELRQHLENLNTRLGKNYMPQVSADFAGSIKGMRSLDSMEDAVTTLLANKKIEANAIADRIQVNLAHLSEHSEFKGLFSDAATIVLKAPDDLRALVTARISEHRAEIERQAEAQRARIRAEEQARADREAAERVAMERETAAAAEAAKPAPTPAPPPIAAPAVVSHGVAPSPTVLAMPQRAAPAVDTGATIRLGQISERLGFAVTAEFLRSLGFEPVGKDRTAVLYRESSFAHICAAIVKHIEAIPASMAA